MERVICFFCNRPLMKRDVERFGFELLEKRGFKVIYLDISDICNRQYASFYSDADLASFEGDVKPATKKEAEEFLSSHKKMFGIDTMKPSASNLWFFKKLKDLGIEYASFCMSAIPSTRTGKKNLLERLRHVLDLEKFAKKLKNIRPRLAAGSIQKAKYLIKGGFLDGTAYLNSEKDPKVIWAHALDYDLFLKHKSGDHEPPIKGDYIVFLDEYFPLHPDFLIKGAVPNPYKDPAEYFSELNSMLSAVEQKLGMKAAIAAHPRSQYEKMSDPFLGREVVKGRTMDLVAFSKAVVAHGSTSINQAVLFKKPVIFFMPEKAKGTYYDGFIRAFAAELGKRIFDSGSIGCLDPDKELKVDEERYSKYVRGHIKTQGSPKKCFWDIIADIAEKE